MRRYVLGLVLLGILGAPSWAAAELQDVRVGGQIVILGEYYRNMEASGSGLRVAPGWLRGRPVGTGPGAGIFSPFGFDDAGGDLSAVSQWTRLSTRANFTDQVGVTIEFDNVTEWGTSFRSNYVTGIDGSGSGSVDLYQAFIEIGQLYGHPLNLRLGRQEIRLGSEWLVGANDGGPAPAWGLSFDGARLTYFRDQFTLDAWATKLFEDGGAEADGDVDFYGLYGSYSGIDDIVLDAYWMYVRDAGGLNDSRLGPLAEAIESHFGVDDYSGTRLHTLGLRASGFVGAFDFEAEIAYQFGDAGHAGALFRPTFYGDSDAEYDNFGVNLEVGYTLPMAWEPRIYLAYAWLEGEDDRDINAFDWVASYVNPFYTRDASVSFNRLFSNWSYSGVLDGTDLSNAHVFHTGFNLLPTEKIELGFDLGYYLADESFARPRVPFFPFWTEESDSELGFEFELSLTYQYSEDLYFAIGWDRLFVGDGLEEGHFNIANGLEFDGGSDDDDVDYFFFETGIFF